MKLFGNNQRRNQTRTIWCQNNRGQKIYGKVHLPQGDGPFPLVIFSHGYGYNSSFIEADRLAQAGIAVYEFDFCGGSPWSRSQGKSTEMSVLTEADDLEAVLDELKGQAFVDPQRIFLSGGSQGGFVSIIVGARRQADIQGMILYCPALVIQDFEEVYLQGRMPEKMKFGNMTISRKYYTDAHEYDLQKAMVSFEKPVLYYQGDQDEMVPLRYAYYAQESFPKMELTILKNTGHMCNYGNEERLFADMKDFILL